MSIKTQTDLILALERNEFESIIGTEENDWIDFKKEPYQLDKPYQKWELAKDVAAFANSKGGVIVIGFSTNRPETSLGDIASEHHPVPKRLINWDAYRQVISKWIYPRLNDLQLKWFPKDNTKEKAVILLIVPPQNEEEKYFIVRQEDNPEGKFPGALAIPVRQGDAITWISPGEMHSLIREARQYRFNIPIKKKNNLTHNEKMEKERIISRCTHIEELASWENIPFISIHAIPNQIIKRPDNFYKEDGIKAALSAPEFLRNHGFNLNTGAFPKIQSDGSITVFSNTRALWLSPDGHFSAACRADSEFLGWYINSDDQDPVAINPKVLVEFIYEFTRFFFNHVRNFSNGDWSLGISIIGQNKEKKIVLVPTLGSGGELSKFWSSLENSNPLLSENNHLTILSTGTAEKDAYNLLNEFYSTFFGSPSNNIPFVKDGEISQDLLLQQK